MKKPSLQDYRLYFVTDSRLHRGYSVLEQVELALQGGVRIIQIREKELCRSDCVLLVSEALKLAHDHHAFLIVNDSVEVALGAGAHGVHLGQDDMPVREARELLGPDLIIGCSVKTPEEARKAEESGADYVAVNGVFPTGTKTDLGYCPGLEGVSLIRSSTRLPVVGIGGINLQNCRSVIEAGAHGIAVVTAITMSENIPRTCQSLVEALGI
jgi:thiamine-phosphate diphosphorylase